ncbi:XVIPCD domain-containing protein [Variovorax sp. DXTD-1]|uniref:XVIPCD domain-containing protein n=1 Tax=Variovorax sp. DXTD-1 TaxID=2495592 RepID=UPI000F8817E4|nr:XVIPCD domain-containing protein [Variovorax sp. DXTD-1]RST45006.1 hypothetical protein EJI00_24580 [Variovorax sp. DXTD-1]
MSSIDSKQALSVLVGSEGASGNKVTLAVPNSMLGKERGKNGSGFSFGTVQLDIGNNTEAKAAYKEILAVGVANNSITQAQADDLAKYAIKRPDLNEGLSENYKAALKTLNATVFNPDSPIASKVNAIIAEHQKNHLDKSVVAPVNDFLKTHSAGVFDSKNKDYGTAVASLVSSCNRSGNLDDYAAALKGNTNPTLDDAKKAWDQQLPGKQTPTDWDLVKSGAKSFAAPQERSDNSQPSNAHTAAMYDPAHPGNPLFKQAQAGMQAIDAKYGRTSDHQTDNAAGHVAVKAQCAGMKCIDHLVLGGNSGDRIIAVQGKLGSGLSKVISVDTVEALNMPLAQSSQASAEVHAQQQGQRAQQVNQPVQAQTAPAMSR